MNGRRQAVYDYNTGVYMYREYVNGFPQDWQVDPGGTYFSTCVNDPTSDQMYV